MASRSIDLLLDQTTRGKQLLDSRFTRRDIEAWVAGTLERLTVCVGANSAFVTTAREILRRGKFPPFSTAIWFPQREVVERLLKLVEEAVAFLERPIDFGTQGTEDGTHASNKVFLVHGRDDRRLHEIVRFLEQMGLQAIVLRELPNEGRTIIQKFLNYADVSFAVILLTPDDRGGLADQGVNLQPPRARQNVVFELGFFIGRLGSARVCALYPADPLMEIPSDYHGVLFIALDVAGGWKKDLATEIRAAGIAVDLKGVLK